MTPVHLTFIGRFVAAPLIAAAIDTPRITLATAVATIAITTPFLTVVNEPPNLSVTERWVVVSTVVVVSGLALAVNAVVTAAQRRMVSDELLARTTQIRLRPSST
ncbi:MULTISPECIES: hypothetical protein [unclassified Streptomyces]|uniref:hypothetical protein n=1 Tax=unclassified Streptomyces TaxID=2593676 RepID=UPI0011A0D86E|nr:hypothetical protein [Streptomyces sp. CNQ-509]